MDNAKKIYKRTFWPVFVVIFIVITAVIGKTIFDSVYQTITNGYKPTLILPGVSVEQNAISDTERYGYITSDEVWSGTIRVTGDIFVSKRSTLTIKPGTTVLVSTNSDKNNLIFLPFMLKKGIYTGEKFRDKYVHRGEPYEDEANHISIWVEGALEAIGTPENKIIIKSDSPVPGRYDWTRFHIEHGAISYAEISNYRGLDLRTGTKLTNSELYNGGGCLICMRDSNNILIEGNWLHDSNHEIIDNNNSSPTIINNRLGPSPQVKNPGGYNAGWGGLIVGSGFPTIQGNTIEGFNDAVSFFDKESYEKLGAQVLRENTFKGNRENVIFNPSPD